MLKPIIGITSFTERRQVPNRTYGLVSEHYVRAIKQAGGVPIIIPITDDETEWDQYAALVDGMLFSGGEDISPLTYGEAPIKEVSKFNPSRDLSELSLFKKIYDHGKPILGICRGHQLINVALGGTLYQDISLQLSQSHGHNAIEMAVDEIYHRIEVVPYTWLASFTGESHFGVNSLHHQAVKRVGDGLVVGALAQDGVIEATENMEGRFLLTVQWHPEDMTLKHELQARIFKAFVNAAT